MKLIYYEFRKLLSKKIILFMLPILLFACVFLYVQTEWNLRSQLISERSYYEQVERAFRNLTQDEGLSLATSKVEELEFFLLLSTERDIGEIDHGWKQRVAEEKKEHPGLVVKYLSSIYNDNHELLKRDLYIYKEIKKQFTTIAAYHKYLTEMDQKASDMLSVSIFHDEESYSFRNIEKTVDDFKPLHHLSLTIGLEYGIVTSTNFLPTDLCALLILLTLSTIIFHYEKDMGVSRLIGVTKKGKLDTAFAKLIVICVMTLCISVLYYGSILAASYFLYGFGEIDRFIQSMPSFKESIYNFTVREYLIIYLILKFLGCLLLSLGVSSLFILFRRVGMVYFLLLLTLGISSILYFQIHPNSYANFLKYLNIIAFTDTFHLIGEYRNINFFSYPIQKSILTYIIGGALIVLFSVLTVLLYIRQVSLDWNLPFYKIWGGIQSWWFKRRRKNSLFFHEWYKLMILNRGWLIVLLSCIFFLTSIQTEQRKFNTEEAMYNQYMDQLSGELNDSKKAFIEAERQYFNQLSEEQKRWRAHLADGAVTLAQYREKEWEWQQSTSKEKAFKLVEKQYHDLLRVEERTKIAGHFVNKITTDELFDRKTRDIILGLLYLSLMSMLLSSLFTHDYLNNCFALLRSTKYGRGYLFWIKTLMASTLCLVLLLLIYWPMYFSIFKNLPKIEWSAPIQSVGIYGELPWHVSIMNYVLILNALKFIGCILLIHIIQAVSFVIRRPSLNLMVQVAALLSPLILIHIGFDSIIPFTFNGIFLLSMILKGETASNLIVLYFSALIFVSFSSFLFSWKKVQSPFSLRE